jgi:CRISPR-associated protein Cas1
LRDRINQTALLDRCVNDIKHLLLPDGDGHADLGDAPDVLMLQDDSGRKVASGFNHDAPDDYGRVSW